MVAKQNAFLTFLLKRDQFLNLSVGEMTAAAGWRTRVCEIHRDITQTASLARERFHTGALAADLSPSECQGPVDSDPLACSGLDSGMWSDANREKTVRQHP